VRRADAALDQEVQQVGPATPDVQNPPPDLPYWITRVPGL